MVRRLLLTAVGAGIVLVIAAAGAFAWFANSDALRRALERETSAWAGEPVRIGDVSAVFFPRLSLRLANVRVGDPPRVTLANVTASTPLRALISGRVEDAELTIADSRLEMPLALALPVALRAAAAEPGDDGPLEIVSIRSIALRDVIIVGGNREILVSADSSLTGTRMTISRFTASSGNTELVASGTMDLDSRVEARMAVRAETLDVDDLMAAAAAFGGAPDAAAPSGGREPPRITADITAPRGTLAGLEISRFEARVVASDGQVVIDPLAFDVLGGRYSGAVDAGTGAAVLINARGGVANVDAAALAAWGAADGAISGRLYGSGRFSGRGADVTSALQSVQGIGQIVIGEGEIPNLNLVRAAVLFFGHPDDAAPRGSGNRFDEITATFALANRTIRTDDLTLHADDLDVFARGTLDLDSNALSGRADLVLSEELSAQAGRDLFRYTRTGDRIVLPATIGGTLGNPTVGIDTAAALERGIRNDLERRLQDLLQRAPPF